MLALFLFASQAHGETQRFAAADAEGVQAFRSGNKLLLNLEAGVSAPIEIPRIMASLVSIEWMGDEAGPTVTLKPEPKTSNLHWKGATIARSTLVLTFDTPPLLPKEAQPNEATGDGSFFLPAHRAKTKGENIRYEPQPHKNTVGYWTGQKDSATWTIDLKKPGRFNVAVLQGCGKGQGGSTATMTLQRQGKQTPDATRDFEVKETGHFQNFQWVNLGEVELANDGVIELVVAPKQIKKAALMDIRAIHLIRLPDKKK